MAPVSFAAANATLPATSGSASVNRAGGQSDDNGAGDTGASASASGFASLLAGADGGISVSDPTERATTKSKARDPRSADTDPSLPPGVAPPPLAIDQTAASRLALALLGGPTPAQPSDSTDPGTTAPSSPMTAPLATALAATTSTSTAAASAIPTPGVADATLAGAARSGNDASAATASAAAPPDAAFQAILDYNLATVPASAIAAGSATAPNAAATPLSSPTPADTTMAVTDPAFTGATTSGAPSGPSSSGRNAGRPGPAAAKSTDSPTPAPGRPDVSSSNVRSPGPTTSDLKLSDLKVSQAKLPADKEPVAPAAPPILPPVTAHPGTDPTATLGALSQVAPAASVSAAAPAAASASTAAAAAQPPVYQQVIAPVLHLSARGDGIHRVLLELHPADLGAVNVEVRIQSGSMSIAINSGSDAARESIRASLPQLHQELANAGLGGTGVSLDFGSPDSAASGGRESAQQRPADSASNVGPARESPVPSATSPASLATSGIDRWL